MILIVVLIVVVTLLMVALIIAVPLRSRSRPPEPESGPSLDEVYQSYLATMHNGAVQYLRNEAPGDREWIEGIKAQARANVGMVSWFEIDFAQLQHIRELNPTYVEMPSEFVAYARAS